MSPTERDTRWIPHLLKIAVLPEVDPDSFNGAVSIESELMEIIHREVAARVTDIYWTADLIPFGDSAPVLRALVVLETTVGLPPAASGDTSADHRSVVQRSMQHPEAVCEMIRMLINGSGRYLVTSVNRLFRAEDVDEPAGHGARRSSDLLSVEVSDAR